MSKVASILADRLVSFGLDDKNRDVYEYALECLLNSILAFGIILTVSAIIGRFAIALTWMMFFLPVRHTSGGLHAGSHIGCLALSLSIGIGCVLITPFLTDMIWFMIIGVIFSLIVIFLLAPVIHIDHPLSEQRIRKTRKTARYIICIESCLVILFNFVLPSRISIAAVLGILSATTSTLIGSIKK